MLVLNNPSGLKVHPSSEHDPDPVLTQALVVSYPAMGAIGDDPTIRPGLVHRLDKEASGVLITAKTAQAYAFLKAQFKERAAKKIYTVLVYGTPSKPHGELQFRLERSKDKGTMIAHPAGSDRGREAQTEYDVIRSFSTTSLLRVQIHTGRTHQIRAHFLAIDHPVVGDTLYRKRHMKHIREIPLGRLFLHASELTITLPSGETRTFTAPLPDQLEDVLQSLT